MLKVLIYSPLSLRFGGGFERWILEIVPRLRAFNVSSTIICTKSTVGDSGRFSNLEIQESLAKSSAEYLELPYIPLRAFSSNSPIPMLNEIRGHMKDCDIVYFSNAYAFQDVLIYVLKLMQKKPVVSGQHATLFADSVPHNLYVSTIEKRLLKRFDACHLLNSYEMQIFKKWGLRKLYLIPIGVDTQRFRVRKKARGHGKFKVLFVGRLTPQKGVDILCNAIALVNKNERLFRNVEFVLVGSGSMQSLVQNLVRRHENVRFLKAVTSEALPGIYRSCDLFVMPSRRETFGMVALEAQASGLPVIASNIPGPSEIVVNGSTGTLIQKESSKVLASAITKYYDLWTQDFAKYKQMCARARDNALKQYDWSVISRLVYRMLRNVVNQDAVFN
jgi:glycosyltransferase involved in cell wall biosynthesis